MFVKPLFFALKSIPNVKCEKKAIDNNHFFTFFTTLGLIWPTPTLIFFAWFLVKYVRGFN